MTIMVIIIVHGIYTDCTLTDSHVVLQHFINWRSYIVSYELDMSVLCECGRVEEKAVMECIKLIYLYFHGSPEGK